MWWASTGHQNRVAHRVSSSLETCSYKRNKHDKHSYGCNKHAQRDAECARNETASKWRQLKETTIWICVWWVVTNETFVLYSHVRFSAACIAAAAATATLLPLLWLLFRFVCYDGFVQLSFVAFPLSATTQHTVLYTRACVGVNATTNEQKTAVWIYIYTYSLCFAVHLSAAAELLLKISFKHNIVWLVHSSVGFNDSIEITYEREMGNFLCFVCTLFIGCSMEHVFWLAFLIYNIFNARTHSLLREFFAHIFRCDFVNFYLISHDTEMSVSPKVES